MVAGKSFLVSAAADGMGKMTRSVKSKSINERVHLTTFKRTLSLMLVLVTLLGILPIPAAAADIRTDITNSIRIDQNSYTKYGSYNSPTLGASCTIHDITANIGGGQYRKSYLLLEPRISQTAAWHQAFVTGLP